MPRDKPIPGSAEDWLARAKGNLAIASQSKLDEVFWEDLAFQAQQAAEQIQQSPYFCLRVKAPPSSSSIHSIPSFP